MAILAQGRPVDIGAAVNTVIMPALEATGLTAAEAAAQGTGAM